MKETVDLLGQRFLFITEMELLTNNRQPNLVDSLLQTVNTELGQLDVFIDLSAQKSVVEPEHRSNLEINPVQPSWQIRQAVFAELAGT